MKKKTKRIAFRLDDDLHRQIEDIADAEEVSVGQLVRQVLHRAVKLRKSRSLKKSPSIF